ncbi:hypothetical protein BDV95DRAFT_299278 [Massariosphaeria phaeospora]|uniref:Uncharacterized protein n=1 Tax=Massariosphaeria phaeospora TaxID=100035 RepID=A0A7C8IAV2_9PLEO|nr:hypothetical protein BDV95DRAFT_299278 [Massariosphaeria phaeospora]
MSTLCHSCVRYSVVNSVRLLHLRVETRRSVKMVSIVRCSYVVQANGTFPPQYSVEKTRPPDALLQRRVRLPYSRQSSIASLGAAVLSSDMTVQVFIHFLAYAYKTTRARFYYGSGVYGMHSDGWHSSGLDAAIDLVRSATVYCSLLGCVASDCKSAANETGDCSRRGRRLPRGRAEGGMGQ